MLRPDGLSSGSKERNVLYRIRRAQRNRIDREAGFTLIELLVVMIIVGILAAIAIPVFLNQRNSGYDASAKSDVKNASTAEETYFTDNNAYTATAGNLPGWSKSSNTSAISLTAATSPDAYKIVATSKSGKFFCFNSANSGGGVTKVTAVSAC